MRGQPISSTFPWRRVFVIFSSTDRISWIDNLKALGILLVVLGHNSIDHLSNKIIFSFHMPLFFFVSGLLFYQSVITKMDSFPDFIKKRARSILIPYFLFSFLTYGYWLIIHYIFLLLNSGYNHRFEPIKAFFGIFVSNGAEGLLIHNPPLWFMTCLFVTVLLFASYYFLSEGDNHILLIMVVFSALTGFLLSKNTTLEFQLPWGIDIALTAVVFYSLGYWMMKMTPSKRDNVLRSNTLLIIAVSILACSLAANDARIEMGKNLYGSILSFYSGAVSGIYIVTWCCVRIPRSKIMQYLGANTIIILALHTQVLGLIKYFQQYVMGLPHTFGNKSLIGGLTYLSMQLVILLPIMWLINRHFPWMLGKSKAKEQREVI